MRKKLQWLILSRLVIAGALLAAIGVSERGGGPQSFTRLLALGACFLTGLSAVYLLALKARIPLEWQGYGQLVLDLLLITALVHFTGDVESPFPALYLVTIFGGSALFGRRVIFSLATMGAVLYGGNSFLKMSGMVSRAPGYPAYDHASIASSEFLLTINLIAIFGVAILSSQLAERARRSEDELAIATRDLADYRIFNDRIIESMRSGLITTDLRGSIVTFNRAAEEITGYKAHQVRGSSVFAIFGDIEKQIEVGLESIRTRTRLPRFDITCRTADGREIHLGFSVAPLVDEDNIAHREATSGYVLTFQDLTEVMELEREVRRQERLAALGKMAAGLAHEIRNPLASMRGSVQVLAGELNLNPDQAQLMEIVLRESDRLNRIVSDFLVYARPPRIERSVIELSSILSETIALLRNSPELSRDHVVVEDYGSSPVHYNADPNQMRQIFWNLARNAIQAMPRGGRFSVTLDAPEDTQEGEVTIVFADTGQGMTRDQKDRMFEPFNSGSGGTGLGMAIVYQLVRDHNGRVVVESETGAGTRISIKLPGNGRVPAARAPVANLDSIIAPRTHEPVGTRVS